MMAMCRGVGGRSDRPPAAEPISVFLDLLRLIDDGTTVPPRKDRGFHLLGVPYQHECGWAHAG